ncbi:MAG: hypothetical protein ACI3VB_01455 [Oscillospiraceae bacterium]
MKKDKDIKKERNKRAQRIIFMAVLLAFAVTMVYLIIRVILMALGHESPSGRSIPEYFLMIGQCIVGLVLLFLPSFVAKKLTFSIPSSLYVVYAVFLYFAIYLGEIGNFFYRVPYWDVMLHGFSGVSLGALGFSVVTFLNRDERIRMSLSPLFVAFFSFCFAVAMGALWEICEFTIDGILGVNMQKFALQDGTKLIGRSALMDTMKDLIVDSVGALISTIAGYFTILKDRSAPGNSVETEGQN